MSVKSLKLRNVKYAFLILILALSMAGCVSEEGASMPGAGDIAVSGSDGGDGNDGKSGSQTGSFSLAWTAPITRADGSPISLAEIDGYRVYYGSTPGEYPESLDINDGSATTATVSGLAVGDYYIVMTTYDSDGRESTQSGALLKQAI